MGTDKRIMGHLVMCFIAYLCEAHLTKELRRRGFLFQSPATETASIAHRPLTVVQGMKALLEVRAVPVKVRGAIIWIRTEITGTIVHNNLLVCPDFRIKKAIHDG